MLPSAEEMHAALILGQKMRAKQKEYFSSGRNKNVLIASKALEKEFDATVRALLGAEKLL